LTIAIKVLIALSVIFWIHRLFSFGDLSAAIDFTRQNQGQAFLVGAMSDFWCAFLFSLIFLFLTLLLKKWIRPDSKALYFGFLSILASLTVMHQGYIAFYQFQIIPFHLQYFGDWDFLTANAGSLLNPYLVLAASIYGCAIFFIEKLPLEGLSFKRLLQTASILLLGAIGIHNRNIHFRVQWFVPESLQTNGFEHLYLSLKNQRIPQPLKPDEIRFMESSFNISVANTQDESSLLNEIVLNSNELPLDELGRGLRSLWTNRLESEDQPSIIVILLESQRPAESGLIVSGPTLTPNLDRIARNGFYFSNAYSTGTVTRSGQEAVFCGTRSGTSSSLMRGRPDVYFSCLPRNLKNSYISVKTLWLHGGDERFDGQYEFWKTQGIDRQMSERDFPNNTVRSGWGVSDRSMFAASAGFLEKQYAMPEFKQMLAMVLSVTNHSPWALPEDAPEALRREVHSLRPSYQTTRYTDDALGQFVEDLRNTEIWENSLVIIASDHGNNEPSYNKGYDKLKNLSHKHKSHIFLVLSGGILETIYENDPETPHSSQEVVSQADVGAFINVLMAANSQNTADPLFSTLRQTPVYSDLDHGIYVPDSEEYVANDYLLEGQLDSFKNKTRAAAIFHRAYLRAMNYWVTGQED
jgi:phosphoglycerol transferase MdoB-like AlkP superfamily enzyme